MALFYPSGQGQAEVARGTHEEGGRPRLPPRQPRGGRGEGGEGRLFVVMQAVVTLDPGDLRRIERVQA